MHKVLQLRVNDYPTIRTIFIAGLKLSEVKPIYTIWPKWLIKLKTNLFIRRVLVLAGGTAIAQIILIASSPILTRVYLAEDFGVMASMSATVAILSIFSTLRYELSIPTILDEQVAFSMLILCFVLVGVVSSVIYLLLFFFIEALDGVISFIPITAYWYFIPLMVCIQGICSSLNYWLIRDKCFSGIAQGACCQSILMTVTKTVAGLLGGGRNRFSTGAAYWSVVWCRKLKL